MSHQRTSNRFLPGRRWLWIAVALVALALASPVAAQVRPVADVLRDSTGDGTPDRMGRSVELAGVLVMDPVPAVLGNTVFLTNLHDSTGGIYLLGSAEQLRDSDLHRGDTVRVRGLLTRFQGLILLELSAVEQAGRGAEPRPVAAAIAQVLAGDYDGRLVRMQGTLAVQAGSQDRMGEFLLRDETGEIPVEINHQAFHDPAFAEQAHRGGEISLTGLVTRLENAGGEPCVHLAARDAGDVVFLPSPPWRAILLTVLLGAAVAAVLWLQRNRALRQAARMAELASRLRRSEAALRESEGRYRSLFENLPEMIFSFNPDGSGLEVNPASARVLGYTLEEMCGLNGFAVVAEEDAEKMQQVVERLVAGDTSVNPFVVRLRAKDGSLVPVETTAFAQFDEQGRLYRLGGISRDIRERLRLEQQVRESEGRYRSLFENAQDIVFRYDLDGSNLHANPASERILGFTDEDLAGRNAYEFVPAEQREWVRQSQNRRAAGEDAGSAYRVDVPAKDGRIVTLEVTSRAVFREGQPVAIEGIARDITERRQLEQHLREVQKLQAVGHLAGGVAHEFNNLLMIILGHSDLLLETTAGTPGEKNARQVHQAGQRAADLVRQLLTFSNRQPVQPTVLDLNRVVSGMDGMLRPVLGRRIELELAPASEPATILGDPAQLEQVILNLALNARDAMPEGGRLRMEVSRATLEPGYLRREATSAGGLYVMLAVSDTGTGIPADVLPHIYDPFFTTKRPDRGTGLGLATVFSIVRQSGGHIEVDTEVGRGTTFRIYLPLAGQDATDAKNADDATVPATVVAA